MEDLSVTRWVQNRSLAKSIHDGAWGQFREVLACKAAWGRPTPTDADRRRPALHRCEPRAPVAGLLWRWRAHRGELTLAERGDRRVCCGVVIDRDLNASQNILAVG